MLFLFPPAAYCSDYIINNLNVFHLFWTINNTNSNNFYIKHMKFFASIFTILLVALSSQFEAKFGEYSFDSCFSKLNICSFFYESK